jgi:hypothetical protein
MKFPRTGFWRACIHNRVKRGTQFDLGPSIVDLRVYFLMNFLMIMPLVSDQ